MILLKHLAREYDIDPYKLRQLLRKKFPDLKPPEGYRRWRWEDPQHPDLIKIRAFLKTHRDTSAHA